ncbi:MAG TPA: dTDP-4-dehydrorhamnose reductase, partial [Dehalococcoidia bacterium]|nr:dTDP-4-dehydrorhamnose reductase [Dehalococcoidia bacterium]
MGPVAVLGATGQLGSDLCRLLADMAVPHFPLAHADLDICQREQVARVLAELRPRIVVNCAAFHQVERCEEEPERALAVNALAVRDLALVCRELGALLVHISTDYVFDGEKGTPYLEHDPVGPVNAYGISKAAGEFFLRSLWPEHIIVRTSGLYGQRGSSVKGGNFVETMLRLGAQQGEVWVVTDQTLSPTYTLDLARGLWAVVEAGGRGTYHIVNSGCCSWYEFACAIFSLAGMAVRVHPV